MTPRHPPFAIIAQGSGWLAINKPAGFSVHNQPGEDICSLTGRHIQTDPDLRRTIGWDNTYGLHAVHRLDSDTSGILLMACRRDLFAFFSRQFQAGTVQKQYLALVHGTISGGKMDEWQVWSRPLTKSAGGRRNPSGNGKRVPCETRYRVVENTSRYTLLACRLITGRRHQIRRHAAISGHPVVGDRRYGSAKACRYLADRFDFHRLGLHAAELEINLPGQEKPHRFALPDLPDDMKRILKGTPLEQRERGG